MNIEAIKFFEKMRQNDDKVMKIVTSVQDILSSYLNGIQPTLVGSVAMSLNIPTSDIDFAISLDLKNKIKFVESLKDRLEFRGERPAGIDSTRFLFCMKYQGYHIDLNLMDENDFKLLKAGMLKAKFMMTIEEKANHTFLKNQLKESGRLDEFENHKLTVYKRFCPNLLWVTDQELVLKISEDLKGKGTPLPQWLVEKLKSQRSVPVARTHQIIKK